MRDHVVRDELDAITGSFFEQLGERIWPGKEAMLFAQGPKVSRAAYRLTGTPKRPMKTDGSDGQAP